MNWTEIDSGQERWKVGDTENTVRLRTKASNSIHKLHNQTFQPCITLCQTHMTKVFRFLTLSENCEKRPLNFLVSVCLSVRMEELGSH